VTFTSIRSSLVNKDDQLPQGDTRSITRLRWIVRCLAVALPLVVVLAQTADTSPSRRAVAHLVAIGWLVALLCYLALAVTTVKLVMALRRSGIDWIGAFFCLLFLGPVVALVLSFTPALRKEHNTATTLDFVLLAFGSFFALLWLLGRDAPSPLGALPLVPWVLLKLHRRGLTGALVRLSLAPMACLSAWAMVDAAREFGWAGVLMAWLLFSGPLAAGASGFDAKRRRLNTRLWAIVAFCLPFAAPAVLALIPSPRSGGIPAWRRWWWRLGPLNEQAFLNAIWNGDLATVKAQARKGADVNCIDRQTDGKPTALILAFKAGHDEIAQCLMSRGADVNGRDANGNTCLFNLERCKDARVMAELLIARGADVHIRNGFGKTALAFCPPAVAGILGNAGAK
jgi:hypothetical protein